MKRGDAVLVRWMDAHTWDGWTSYVPGCSLENVSVGLLIADEKDRVVIAQSCSLNPEAEPYDQILEVPRGMICQVLVLKKGAIDG